MTLDDAKETLEDSLAQLDSAIDRRNAEYDRIKQVLADFYRSPLSMSSVQPILDLAVELNPSLNDAPDAVHRAIKASASDTILLRAERYR